MQYPNDNPGQDGQSQQPQGASDFVDALSNEDRMLIVLRKELYMNNWDSMLGDLQNRLDGKPYIFKLANRIRDDIARIDKLRKFEQQNGINLSDIVKGPEIE
ncbi:MAG: hypothetical protein JEZ07_12785 [Phycisphaerae bacterium]|nr:hypothetical protein [Phycisphaerae bacterium]